MAARILPGFFLGAAAGVLVDRWDRKQVMVVCDIGRAAVLATLPFVDTVLGLVVASLVLEMLTLLWSPAKEASVPNLVPPDHLTTANSLSLVAAYGTFPVAAACSPLLAKVAEWLGGIDALGGLRTNQEALAFYVDAGDLPALGADDLHGSPLAQATHVARADGEATHRPRPGVHTSSRRAGRSSSSTRWCGRSTWAWPPA